MRKFALSRDDGRLLSSLLNRAIEQWENAVGRELWQSDDSYELSGADSSSSHIRWSNDFGAETGYDPGSTLAVTIRYRTGTFVERVEIILNREDSSLVNNVNNMLYQVILHELGHSIGLDHSEFFSAVMYQSLIGLESLQSDDVNGANSVVDETLHRQSSGFISELVRREDKDSDGFACGQIFFPGDGPSGKGLIGFFLGMMIVFAISYIRSRRWEKISP
jgi:hypothetical protein